MTVRANGQVVKSLSSVCIVPDVAGHVRIGELSRRSGVSPELLRAWEQRYGLLRPERSDGGFRLYSADDEHRIATMRSHLERGLSAAEAARLTLDEVRAPAGPSATPVLERTAGELRAALDALDEDAAQSALDRLLSGFSTETVLREVVLTYLRELGDRWERGDASIAQEHFASQILRGRLLGLARGWDRGGGPRALLACMPGELHDLGLITFGLGLRDRGWRITFLGPDVPLDTLADTVAALQPGAVVLSATTAERFASAREALRRLARSAPVWIAGAGARPEIGVPLLDLDPLAAAERVAEAR
jgi:MerR family transcriptional regulator, light-induced transcriptional regulator